MKIMAVANQKGGVGKTTLSLHIGQCAADQGMRVLLIDLDNQANLSLYFNATSGLKTSALFSNEISRDLPFRVSENLSILRADDSLLGLEKFESTIFQVLKQNLKQFDNDFDLCVIDTAGSLGVRMDSALATANYVITPVSVGLFELSAVAGLLKAIQKIKTSGMNPKLKHIGILPVKTNTRSAEEMRGLDHLKSQYGSAILPYILMERAAVKKAVARRIPIWDKVRGVTHQKAATEWLDACKAILQTI
jgi:chromosome partitioning protein